MEESKFLMD